MKKQLLHDFFKKSPLAFSYHKVLADALGFPVDYEFLGINDALESLVGFKAGAVVGHRYSELFPEPDGDLPGWKDAYRDAIIHRKTVIANRYHRGIQKWLHITVYAIDADYFACFYTPSANENDPASLATSSNVFFAIDQLRGLTSKQNFDKRIEEEIDRSERYDEPLSLLLIESGIPPKPDSFDAYEDTLDKFQQTVEICLSLIRKYDILTRENGFRFILLMPKTGVKGASIVTERIRNALRERFGNQTGYPSIHFSICERADGESFVHWYQRLDEALQRAKRGANLEIAVADRVIQEAAPSQLVWQNAWNSGNDHIDNQHRSLIELSNRLLALLHGGSSFDTPAQLLDLTIDSLMRHFDDEETVLSACGYPELEMISKVHKNLIGKAFSLKESFLRDELNMDEFFSFLVVDVISGHILTEDMAFFPFLQANHRS